MLKVLEKEEGCKVMTPTVAELQKICVSGMYHIWGFSLFTLRQNILNFCSGSDCFLKKQFAWFIISSGERICSKPVYGSYTSQVVMTRSEAESHRGNYTGKKILYLECRFCLTLHWRGKACILLFLERLFHLLFTFLIQFLLLFSHLGRAFQLRH